MPVAQHSPQSALDDRGLGVYGQTTWTIHKRLDIVVGARADREHKTANLNTFFVPAFIAPGIVLTPEKDFSDVSPQFAVAYRVAAEDDGLRHRVAQGSMPAASTRASPTGAEAYDQEHSWNYEGGVKTSAFNDRLWASLAAFHIDWTDMQVNVPNVLVPGQFFIANAAGATSTGVEFELHARVDRDLDLIRRRRLLACAASRMAAHRTVSNVSGNKLANAPQLHRRLRRPARSPAAERPVAHRPRRGDLLRRL